MLNNGTSKIGYDNFNIVFLRGNLRYYDIIPFELTIKAVIRNKNTS